MKTGEKRCLICNCEKSMPLDAEKVSAALGVEKLPVHNHLCRLGLPEFEKALQGEVPLLVACTQEAPLFLEVAQEANASNPLAFVNIREAAGWSKEASKATPKIAALLKDASFEPHPTRLKSVTSDGMCLVYGSSAIAVEAAQMLSKRLSVTLLLEQPEDFIPPATGEVPAYRGTITRAQGSFGAFSIIIDGHAAMLPSSRSGPEFSMARDNVQTECSLILDLSGNAPLFTGHARRDGYFKVDPADPAAVLRAAFELSEMVGEFEKPIYIEQNTEICAHSRSSITGCSKCLDVCPAGAISSTGDHVLVDDGICGGCGSCHSVCPTGSVSYQYPLRTDTIARAQHLVGAYLQAGGKSPVLLLHDSVFGAQMISMIARFGRGLPANVLPVSFHAVTMIGHVELAAFVASGSQQVLLLADPKNEEELAGLADECELANTILNELQPADGERCQIICEPDPEVVEGLLWQKPVKPGMKSASFSAVGSKRDIARMVLGKLQEASKGKPDCIKLPQGAPYGSVTVNTDACTLCMACTSACPTGAITDTPDVPRLRFIENACVQCGLCVNTCPESALSLVPQLDFTSSVMQGKTLYEEEPFECISCGKPFATRSTIERISGQLAGKHTMFSDKENINLIKMCDMCRIETQANQENDPFSSNPRPRPRTTQDYLDAEKGKFSEDDFLMDD